MLKRNIMRRTTVAGQHPLDFTLQYPPRRAYFQENFRAPAALEEARKERDVLLYAHVPFCQSKCYFCNFAVDIRADPGLHRRYTDLLCAQITRIHDFLPDDARVPGIDIGGGTPTLLQAEQLAKILAAMKPWMKRATTKTPLSIETTPRIAASCPGRLAALHEGGVTRISMGVQSANAATLVAVNRGAQADITEKAVENMRRAGFARINADIIFGLPGQTEDDWRKSVEQIIALGVDSVTTYDCLYRGKGRALTKRTAGKPLPETYGRLYDLSWAMLKEAGFHAPYGSVNFSRHAGESGTSPYFEARLFDHVPYFGAGNYASSMSGDYWWFAPHGVNEWMKRIAAGEVLPQGDAYCLPQREMMAKQVLLSLNFGTIDAARFRRRFGLALDDVYAAELEYGQEQGWLRRIEGGYGVTPGHFLHMPQIRSLFYTDDAIAWLLEGDYGEARDRAGAHQGLQAAAR